MARYTLAKWIREDVYWSKDPDANIVHVYYESPDPKFAAQLVNILTHCAGVLMMQENQALSDEAVKWLISQVDDSAKGLLSTPAVAVFLQIVPNALVHSSILPFVKESVSHSQLVSRNQPSSQWYIQHHVGRKQSQSFPPQCP